MKRSIRDEMRLQRIAVADGRDPSGRPPPALRWTDRSVAHVGRHQLLITVPYLSETFETGVHAALTAALRERWLEGGPSHGALVSVVAAFDHPPGVFGRLTLAMTASDAALSATPLDSPRMGRELERALRREEAIELSRTALSH